MEIQQTLRMTPAIERYVVAQQRAGVPRDQMERFMRAGYLALPWQLRVHAAARALDWTPDTEETPTILVGGARGPGKSHMLLAQAGLDDCQRVKGLKFLFLRKIQKAAGESFDDLVQRIFHSTPHRWTPSRGRLTFSNGSRILIGGFRHPSEIQKYLGVQYDGAVIEEYTQLLPESVTQFYGSVRSSIPTSVWIPRVYASSNPGGVGHLEAKKKFVDPYFQQGVRGRYFPATYRDNPFLNPQYVRWLEGIKGPLGKAWRDGDWEAFEGMAFQKWDASRHILEHPVMPGEVPSHWRKWIGVDDGLAAEWWCGFFAQDPKTLRVYVLDEAHGTGLSDTEQAQLIRQTWDQWGFEGKPRGFGDPAMWAEKKAGSLITDTAKEYRKAGVYLEPGDNSRISGKRRMDRLLADYPDGLPGMMFSPVCVYATETIPALPSDPNRPEDVDTDAEDHAYDGIRYGTSRVKTPAIPLGEDEKKKQERRKQRSPLESVGGRM